MHKEQKTIVISKLKIAALSLIGFTIFINKLNLNSVSIMLLCAILLFESDFKSKWSILKKNILWIAFALLFFHHLLSMVQAKDLNTATKSIESKLGLLILPTILLSGSFSAKEKSNAMLINCISITIISLTCIGLALLSYNTTKDESVFFYHDLLKPIDHNAIYFSTFILCCYAYLLQYGIATPFLARRKWLLLLWLLFLTLTLLLLSSKLLIALLIFVTIFYAIKKNISFKSKSGKARATFSIIAALLVILTIGILSPVKKRYLEIINADYEILNHKTFSPGMAFTGLQFRLLTWRFGTEIISEQKAFLFGVGPTNAQNHLNNKYISMNMYTGTEGTGDKGFLAFNFHNQYLQTYVQSGLLGVMLLLIFYFLLIKASVKETGIFLKATVLIILMVSLTESIFERHWGIILATYFPLLAINSSSSPSRSFDDRT